MNSILVLSLCPGDGWHMNAAKHGCDSLPDIATIAINKVKKGIEMQISSVCYQHQESFHFNVCGVGIIHGILPVA